jgi:hypothetical protein
MAFPILDVWPVEVRYAWHDGADLIARVEAGAGKSRQEYVAARGRDLSRTDWSQLPAQARDGRPIRYYVDAPGDDRPSGADGLSRWRRRWREEASRTTWENATYSAELLRQEGVKRVLLVTQAWHMPRARWCFERVGFQVRAAPVGFLGVPNGRPAGGWLPESKALWQSGLLLNEAVGLFTYPLAYP